MTLEDEAYETYIDRKTKVNPFKIIPKASLIILIVLGVAVFYMAFVIDKPWIDKKSGQFILAVLVGIFIILLLREKDAGIITWRQAREIVRREVNFMQKYEDILPPGDIYISEKGFMQRMEGQRQLWFVGFKIEGPEGPTLYKATVDPFDGLLEGFEEMPAGWTGRDRPDIKFILPKELRWRQRYGDVFEDQRKAYANIPEQPTKEKRGIFGRK